MPAFEYDKINLNSIPRSGDDIALLDELGEHGWELIAITPNKIAYPKWQVRYAKKAAHEVTCNPSCISALKRA